MYNKASSAYAPANSFGEITQLELTVAFSSLNEPAANTIALWADQGTGVYPLTTTRGATDSSTVQIAQGTGLISAVDSIEFIPNSDDTGLHIDTGTGNLFIGSFDLQAIGPGDGDVIGPGSSNVGGLALYDDTTGKLIAEADWKQLSYSDGTLGPVEAITGTISGSGTSLAYRGISDQNALVILQADTANAGSARQAGFGLVAGDGVDVDSQACTFVVTEDDGVVINAGYHAGGTEKGFVIKAGGQFNDIASGGWPMPGGSSINVLQYGAGVLFLNDSFSLDQDGNIGLISPGNSISLFNQASNPGGDSTLWGDSNTGGARWGGNLYAAGYKQRKISDADSPFTIVDGDGADYIFINATAGVVGVTLPTAAKKRAIHLKTIAGAMAVTITPAGGQTIGGSPTLVLTLDVAYTLLANGVDDWGVF